MTDVRVGVFLLGVVVLSGALTGCAKRPATSAATAPAPTPAAPAPTLAAPSPGPSVPPGRVEPGPRALATPPIGAPGAGPAILPSRPAPAEFRGIDALRDIHFDFDKYDIRPGDAKILDENAAWMKANASYLVLIEGHADERGTNEYNLALGERRAKAAINYLVAQGVRAGRITIISYGEERPACTEKTEACWARNRRAHFLVKPQ